MGSVLVIEDESLLARSFCEALGLAGHRASFAASGEEGLQAAERDAFDLILLDMRLPGIDGLEVLRELRRRGHDAAVIVMTAYGAIESAVEVMKQGASDYLIKPVDLGELEVAVTRVLEHRRLSEELDYFRRRDRASGAFDDLIGRSPPIVTVKRFVERLVSTPALACDNPPSILLTGETGTGKDMVARAIHYAGGRREAQFVQVNCAALPDHLVESELFGHVRGAFTDARADKRGLFEVADRGTIFLDEIGHMKGPLQAKLLGVLERRAIRPVGGVGERPVNVHVIAATNRDLPQAVEAGEFREDLYHRLRVLSVHLPPLREREGDLPLLAEHFLRIHAARFGIPVKGFAPAALELMAQHDWPGNVRELSHVIEGAMLIADGPLLRPEHLRIQVYPPGGKLGVELPGDRTIHVDFAAGRGCPKLEEIEHQVIQAALEYSRHNLSRAARLLGISRDAVRYRLEKYAREHADASSPGTRETRPPG